MHLRVFVASSGLLLEIHDVKETDIVRSLNNLLAQHTSIEVKNQILLCTDGVALNPDFALGNHPDLSKQQTADVYLFNKQHFASTADIAAPLAINADYFLFRLPAEAPMQEPDLAQSRSSIDITVHSYLRDFTRHQQVTHAYLAMTKLREKECKAVLGKQRAQVAAMKASAAHVGAYALRMETDINDFQARFDQFEQHVSVLPQQIEADLKALGNIDLDPALQTHERTTLLDCLDEGEHRRYLDTLNQELNNYRKKKDMLVTEAKNVMTMASREDWRDTSSPIDQVAREVDSWGQKYERPLVGDVKAAEQSVLMIRNSLQSGDTKGMDILSLEEEKGKHDEAHARIAQSDKEHFTKVKSVIGVLTRSQVLLSRQFKESMQELSELSNSIGKVQRKLVIYVRYLEEAPRKWAKFEKLKKCATAYQITLVEVHRRVKFRKLFEMEMRQFGAKLSTLCATENSRRQFFKNQYEDILPKGIVPGLIPRDGGRGSVPSIDIQCPAFDTELPQLQQDAKELTDVMVQADESSPASSRSSGGLSTVSSTAMQDQQQLRRDLERKSVENEYLATEVARLRAILRDKKGPMKDDPVKKTEEKEAKSEQAEKMVPAARIEALEGVHQAAMMVIQAELDAIKTDNTRTLQTLAECQQNSADLENKLHTKSTELHSKSAELQMALENLDKVTKSEEIMGLNFGLSWQEKSEMSKQMTALQGEVELFQQLVQSRIAFERFQLLDLCLFIATDASQPNLFQAVRSHHATQPNMCLSVQCLSNLGLRGDSKRVQDRVVIGEIEEIEVKHATTLDNPFRLAIGEEYWTALVPVNLAWP